MEGKEAPADSSQEENVNRLEKGSYYLKKLYVLHERKKKAIVERLDREKKEAGAFSVVAKYSQQQLEILEKDLGLLEIDWDQIIYTKESEDELKQTILRKLLKLEEDRSLSDEEEKMVENLLIYLKMYYFLIKEEQTHVQKQDVVQLKKIVFEQANYLLKIFSALNENIKKEKHKVLETYTYQAKNMPITVNIIKKSGEYVPIYELIIASISRYTEYFLEKIRRELIKKVNLGIVDITDAKKGDVIHQKFSEAIVTLINKYFPDVDEETIGFLTTYLIQKSLGMGKIDILMHDPQIEEIAINSANEPVWIYHKKYNWVKTTIQLENEEQTRHYAEMIGRKVGRQLTVLEPLMDASLNAGDRVNATLTPISTKGNTITLRKFAAKPFTVTDLVRTRTISPQAAAMIWLGMQYELSALIIGGTASGKTSMLNAVANLFPPNQRIITIEDTREIQLPSFLHWVPMNTRLPNAEGKGGVTMLDLMINALRQRPDRILVGEIRRKKEAEVAFEAIHTGHSVYGTFHANSAEDAVTRLTSPPIEIPRNTLPGISMLIVQYRNRRSGLRRTFQFAEIEDSGKPNVLLQYDPKKDMQIQMNRSNAIMNNIHQFTGMTQTEIKQTIINKTNVLKYLVKNKINSVDGVGKVMAEYYTNHDYLLKCVKDNVVIK
ncbi:MAG: type II/IV secretion system ATPase subunit [Nanobdellota archaeon]